MSRVIKFQVPHLLLWFLLAILAIAAPAQADLMTYQLTAKPNATGTGGGWGGFSLIYVDLDKDYRFSVADDQLLSFSGVSLTGYPLLNVLTGAAGFKDTLYTDEIGTGTDTGYRSWTFATSDEQWAASGASFCWDYQQSPLQSAVPLPPSAFLLATGLIPFAWARRKKQGRK